MNVFVKAVTSVAIFATLTGAVCAEEINFGIISTESQQNLKPKWEPFLADFAKMTGLEVKPFFASDYSGVIEGMRFGKVQIAWYGNKSAMEAVDRAGGEIFAQSVSADGNPGYWSVILAPKNSKLTSVDDLLKCDRSLNFGIGDPNSTSGFLRIPAAADRHRSGSNGAIAGWVSPVTMRWASSLPVAGPSTMPHMPWPPAT